MTNANKHTDSFLTASEARSLVEESYNELSQQRIDRYVRTIKTAARRGDTSTVLCFEHDESIPLKLLASKGYTVEVIHSVRSTHSKPRPTLVRIKWGE